MFHRLLPILALLLTVLTTGYGQVVPGQEPKKPGPGEDTLKVPPTQEPESLTEEGVAPPSLQNFLPLSPGSAAMARYGEYPVSLFTGLPTIQIPIYEIKTPRFTLPLQLSYHASGIKVTDAAPWVGLGWSLQGGGAVRRRVRGIPDEGSQGVLQLPLDRSIPQDCSQDDNDELALRLMYNKNKDSEPDEFSWNLPNGKSGKFFYRGGGQGFIMQPLIAVKIEGFGSLDGFLITDTDGSVYRFGRSLAGANAKETTDVDNPGKTYSFPTTAWLLTEMVSADKSDTLFFQYTQSYTYQTDLVEQITFYDEAYGSFSSKQSPLSGEVPVIQNVTTYLYEQNLSTIIFRNGRLLFQKDSVAANHYGSRERLRQIDVQERLGSSGYETIQSYRLAHGYYASTAHTEKRLRLDSLAALDRSGQTVHRHHFSYNTIPLPEHTSPSRDYWGYYNHATQPSYSSRIPVLSIPYNFGAGSSGSTTIGTANRVPDSTYMKAGVLQRITYPTGGRTDFDYEPNFYDVNGQVKMASGLRVRRISSLAGTGSLPMVKSYRYALTPDSLATVSGAGRINANTLNPDWTISQEAFRSSIIRYRYRDPNIPGDGGYTIRSYSSDPNMGLVGMENAPVVYPKVVEYRGDPAAQEGYTVHNFNDFGDNYGPNAYPLLGEGTRRMEDFSWRRGRPTATYVYGQSNLLLKKSANGYSTTVAQVDSIGILTHRGFTNDFRQVLSLPSCPYDYGTRREYFHAYYTLTTGLQQLTASSETDYPSSGAGPVVTKEMTYAYDAAYYLPKEKQEQDSRGETYRTTYVYPFDFATGVYPCMKQRRIIQKPVVQSLYHNEGGSWKRLSLDSLHYEALKPAFATDTMFLPTQHFQAVETHQPEQLSDFQYDNRGNVVQVMSRDGIPNTLLWGYRQALAVARVENATYAQVTAALGFDPGDPAQASFQNSTGSGLLGTLQAVRAQLPAARVTTYAYQPLVGLTHETDPNGKTLFYEYDAFSRLGNLRDSGPGGFVRASYCYNYAGQPVDCGTIAPTGITNPPQLFLLADSIATTLHVTPDSLYFSALAGHDNLLVIVQGDSLTQDWTVTIPDSVTWLTVSPMQGRNDTTAVTVQVTAASGPSSRSATFSIRSAELDTTIRVTVIQSGICLPPIIAGDSVRALCAGSSVFLLASGCPGGTIRWSTNQTGIGITVTTPGSYSAACESADCQSAASRSILVQAVTLVAPTVVASVDTVCSGQAVQLTATGCAGAVSWNSTVTGLIPDNIYASQITVKPSQNVSFTARCLNLDCPSVASAPLAVIVKPSPDFTLATDGKALCTGDTLQLSVSTTQTGLTANWQGPGGWTASGLSVKRLNATAGVNGYYRVSVSNGTCQRQDSILVATSLIDSQAGPVISTSTIRFLEADSSYVLDLESTPADAELTYQWYRNGRLVSYAVSANWKDTLALNSPRNVVASYQVQISKAGCTARLSETFYLYKTTDSSALVLTNAVRRIEMEPGNPATIKGFDCQGTELWRDSFAEGRVSLTAMPSERQTYEINGADCAVLSDTVWLNTATLCSPNSVLYTFTERATGDVGYFNPADSLYYWKVVKEIVYNGQVDDDGNCLTQERIAGYDEPYSAKFYVNWLGPDPLPEGEWQASLVLQTSLVYLPRYSFPYRSEVGWNAVNNREIGNNIYADYDPDQLTYINVDPTKPLYIILYKRLFADVSARKCIEVSLSETQTFDSTFVLHENDGSSSDFTPLLLNIDSIIQTGRKFIVVREKACNPVD